MASNIARAPDGGGYRKGDEARERILDSALTAFGTHGFKGATTRAIAEEAGVNLPALTYYFGGKEGLYLACAEEIVARYSRQMLGPIAQAQAAVVADRRPAAARAALKLIVGTLAEHLISTQEAQIWTAFVMREMSDQGPAFKILYAQVWAPGVEVIAFLIARAQGENTTTRAARVEALLLISSLSAFSIARPVALKYLDWPDTRDKRFAQIKQILDAQIERIGR